MNVIRGVRARAALVLAGCSVFTAPLAGGQAQPPQEPATIRTRVTMVPVDVRVLGRDGRAVTDLTPEDFSILEDGVPHPIAHFSTQVLRPEPPAALDQPVLRRGLSAPVTPQNRRVFLILLGLGRMTGPSDELRALRDFLRSRLLPQDQVAVMAYNRATGFTTDRSPLLELLERYRTRHTTVDSMLAHHFRDLQAQYGSREILPHIQKEINAIFAVDEPLGARNARSLDITRMTREAGETMDAVRRADAAVPGRDSIAVEGDWDAVPSLDEYLADRRRTLSDIGNLVAAIEYLRRFDGEKHLVFVTPRGFSLSRPDSGRGPAAMAGDGRVALHVLYTGGVVAAPQPRFAGINSAHPGAIIMSAVPGSGAVFGQTFAARSMRAAAEVTGGELTAFRSAHRALARLDQATRFQYVLGYYPSHASWDGSYRRIEVKVNRRDVKVMHRRGYRAAADPPPLDPRESLADIRLAAAAGSGAAIEDIRITLQPPVVTGEPETRVVEVAAVVDVSRVGFREDDGRVVGSLDVRIYAGDTRGQEVGSTHEKVDMRLTAGSYERMMRDGMAFAVALPVCGPVAFVRVIVYDSAPDLLGAVTQAVSR